MNLKKIFKPQMNIHNVKRGNDCNPLNQSCLQPKESRSATFYWCSSAVQIPPAFSLLCSLRSLRLNRQFYKTNPNSRPYQFVRRRLISGLTPPPLVKSFTNHLHENQRMLFISIAG